MTIIKPLVLILLFIFSSCGIQSQLKRSYLGKDLVSIEKEFKMQASQLQKLDDGQTKVIFIKEERLSATPISQGEGTLDPMTSPPVTKIEYFIFILDKEGKVRKSEYQKEYER